MRSIVVGSRKSNLALTQTHLVMDALKALGQSYSYDVKEISTKGDRIQDVTLSKVGGKGLFVKEIERAMLDGEIDIAVHSMKDLPSQLPEGLMIACMPERAPHRDVLVSKDHLPFYKLPEGAVIGTSSLRRAAQFLAKRPDLDIQPIRGNIETRLQKLENGNFDATVLAAAGLERMGWSQDIVTEYLSEDICLSAAGQGTLAIECRTDDHELRALLANINDMVTYRTVSAERAFLYQVEGSCQTPIAAYATLEDDTLTLTGLVAHPDGNVVLKDTRTGTDPEHIGTQLAKRLQDMGAKKILDEVKADLEG